jgi:hypothetical protein
MEKLLNKTIFTLLIINSFKMKIQRLSIIAIALFLAVSCQPDIEKENESVMSVLMAEADALLAADFDAFKALHTQGELETRIEMGIYGYSVYKGWDKVSDLIRDFLKEGASEDVVNTKENCIVHVSGKSAWVTCDNVWFDRSSQEIFYNNLQIAFLEKQGGSWKISFSAYYTKGDRNEMTIH